MVGVNRKSNFELLRILCILGILCMHIYGYIYNESAGINRALGVIINSICNASVPIFFLISGYFGIKNSGKKLILMEVTILFYSLLDLLCLYVKNGTVSLYTCINAMFPILNEKYWFMTCYIIIFVFSKYIDEILNNITEKSLRNIIFISVLFFCFAPTIFLNDIIGDSGKGILNMGLMYIIGRYFAYYGIPEKLRKWAEVIWVCTCGLAIFLNAILSLIYRGKGIYVPYARDNSFLIMGLAISAFIIFYKRTFYSKFINCAATYVFAIYLSEGIIRRFINSYNPFLQYYDTWYMLGILFIWVIIIVGIAYIIETIRRLIFGKLEVIIADAIMKKISMRKDKNNMEA